MINDQDTSTRMRKRETGTAPRCQEKARIESATPPGRVVFDGYLAEEQNSWGQDNSEVGFSFQGAKALSLQERVLCWVVTRAKDGQ